MNKRKYYYVLFIFVFSIIFTNCKKENDDPILYSNNIIDTISTKTKMEGVWVITEAYDSAGTNILSKFQNHLLPVTAFSLTSDNVMLTTAGPMVTYLVFGASKYTQIQASINQYFNYSNLTYTNAEFYIADTYATRFALEFKLETVGATATLSEILSLFGIDVQWLNTTLYNKFMNVGISFNETNNRMTWVFDNQTTTRYNMKDQYGDYVFWNGWPISKFQKCRFVLTKQQYSLDSVITNAYNNPPVK